ncbi:MAG: tRNA guanosine(34) transglycosylase Tgt [Deltaproteobacteria bacterium]|nr:tRNA guanosine(34) transglycosylase Tgt [Deltaproteobacteria bacterium]MCB9786503.1 tRNA guanosine(34) transglycosylase Tgt [Deltaproteobacteria bacterium]
MTCPVPFRVDAVDRGTGARAGRLELARGTILTPVFMPVGTQAALRSLPPLFIRELGLQIILANTYHLHQRPGEAIIQKLGGLHQFMSVDVPILTDSGGFQVFSLDKKEVSEDGVAFAFEVDGKRTFLSPETSMAIQEALGADIAMAFDECLAPGVSHEETAESIERTARWAERSLAAHVRPDQSLFGIVQGGMFDDLRRRSVEQVTSLGFDGFAIGGLSVGEGPEIMNRVLAATTPLMPPEMPRYLMGVGRPQDLVDGIAVGVDMFDCVIPTRHARSGTLYTFKGRIRITHSRYRRDAYAIDTACHCYTCRTFSRAYLHHLFSVGEVLGATLCTIHNLHFFQELMRRARTAISEGRFAPFRREIKELYPETSKGAGDEPRDEADHPPARAASGRAPAVSKASVQTSGRANRSPAGGARTDSRGGQRPSDAQRRDSSRAPSGKPDARRSTGRGAPSSAGKRGKSSKGRAGR